MCIYSYVVMPEHVHLLVNEPERAVLADAMHFLKLAFAKRLPAVPQVRGHSLAPNLGSRDSRPAIKAYSLLAAPLLRPQRAGRA